MMSRTWPVTTRGKVYWAEGTTSTKSYRQEDCEQDRDVEGPDGRPHECGQGFGNFSCDVDALEWL